MFEIEMFGIHLDSGIIAGCNLLLLNYFTCELLLRVLFKIIQLS